MKIIVTVIHENLSGQRNVSSTVLESYGRDHNLETMHSDKLAETIDKTARELLPQNCKFVSVAHSVMP
jgi:hypothetical protein